MSKTIPIQEAQGQFTKAVTAVYKERITPTGAIRSLFTEKVVPTLLVSTATQRTKERVASPVIRGTDGNRNEFSKSSEKLREPLYFREWFDMTKLQLYNALFSGVGVISAEIFAALVEETVDNMMICRETIERAIEKMAADVITTGKVFNEDGSVYIDYKRKAESFTNAGAGNYWANSGVDPFKQIADDCNFLRTVGKSGDAVFNYFLGDKALADLLANDVFQKRQNLFNMALDAVQGPVRNSEGAAFHGIVTAGSYKVQLWSYPQSYDTLNADGTIKASVPYLDAKKAVLVPLNPKFQTVYGAVPQLLEPGQQPAVGKFIYGDYIERRSKSRVLDVESAPLCVPIAIDQAVTRTAVA